MVVDSPAVWLAEMRKIEPAPPTPGSRAWPAGESETDTTWESLMERSFIELSAQGEQAAAAKTITDHVNWDRYLSLIQGRVAFVPIKFNGPPKQNTPRGSFAARTLNAERAMPNNPHISRP